MVVARALASLLPLLWLLQVLCGKQILVPVLHSLLSYGLLVQPIVYFRGLCRPLRSHDLPRFLVDRRGVGRPIAVVSNLLLDVRRVLWIEVGAVPERTTISNVRRRVVELVWTERGEASHLFCHWLLLLFFRKDVRLDRRRVHAFPHLLDVCLDLLNKDLPQLRAYARVSGAELICHRLCGVVLKNNDVLVLPITDFDSDRQQLLPAVRVVVLLRGRGPPHVELPKLRGVADVRSFVAYCKVDLSAGSKRLQ